MSQETTISRITATDTEGILRYDATRGASQAEMASNIVRAQVWAQVCEQIESWRQNPDWFDPEDRPDPAILQTAIEFASDQAYEAEVPSHVAPSGEGRIIFAWQSRTTTFSIEILSRYEAEGLYFDRGKIRQQFPLRWNSSRGEFEQTA